MSGDLLSNGVKDFEKVIRTNIYSDISKKFCSYKKECPVKDDCSGEMLCKFCNYYKRNFNIPEEIRKAQKE